MTAPALTGKRAFARTFSEPRATLYLRRAIIALVSVHVMLAMWSGYRAIVQVFSLDLRVPARELSAGSIVHFDVHSSARAPVTVRVELMQGTRSETLSV